MKTVEECASSRRDRLRKVTDRATNAPQNMRARKTEAAILEAMPARTWLSCTAVSRLIASADDRRTRARLDRLVSEGKVKRRREVGAHGVAYRFCKPS